MRSFERDPDAPLDVWSFRALERLAVHEARTAAENGSRVVRMAERYSLNLVVQRSARDVWQAKRIA